MDAVHSPVICMQPGLYSVEQFQMALEREKARAERNGHGVSLAIIQTGGRGTRERPRLEDVLKGRLRIMDEAGWFDQSRIGVLMPYTSRQGAWRMIEDMCRLMCGALSPADCKVYTYPQDWMRDPETGHEKEDAAEHEVQHAGPAADHPVAAAFDAVNADSVPTWQRGLDIVGAAAGLAILSPVFLVTALVIKLVSPGPVFFRQRRIGRGGTPFVLWKFRTMSVEADVSLHQDYVAKLIRSANEEAAAAPMTKLTDDPRVIPLGRIIRATCVDELPQLFNVLRGEMSLVGPRPPIPYEAREYLPWQRRRFDAAPGLTGLWQVSGKNRLTFDEMIRLDIRYCRTKCLWKAIAIICRTPLAIVGEIADAWVRWKLKRTGVSEHG